MLEKMREIEPDNMATMKALSQLYIEEDDQESALNVLRGGFREESSAIPKLYSPCRISMLRRENGRMSEKCSENLISG
jgi:hypothetical protein